MRVALAKTAMLAAQFAANDEPAAPIEESELERYLIDQDSPIGLLTRVARQCKWRRRPRSSTTPEAFQVRPRWRSAGIPLHKRRTPYRIGQQKSSANAAPAGGVGKFFRDMNQ